MKQYHLLLKNHHPAGRKFDKFSLKKNDVKDQSCMNRRSIACIFHIAQYFNPTKDFNVLSLAKKYATARSVAIFKYLSNKPFNYAMDICSLIIEWFLCRCSEASFTYVVGRG
jgi:hypothetical protein